MTTATGTYPATTTFSETGALPSGVTLSSGGLLSGTPAAGTGGTYSIVIDAGKNGVSPDGTQDFTLSVDQAPAITSANNTTFTVGTPGSFTVTTASGTYPNATFSETGPLPPGVTLSSGGLLSGTPAAGTGGTYSIEIDATNGISPDGTQSFTLTVDQAPVITSANSTTFVVGSSGSFTVTTATGTYPATTTFSETGALPSGVTLSSGGLLSGTPAAGTGGTYSIVIDAGNGVSPDGTQNFTLTVDQAPVITCANSTTFTVGASGSFTVTTAVGTNPNATFTETGALPSGVTLSSSGLLSGTPAAGTGGTYSINIDATNGISPDGTQSFTLTVDQAPAITSGNSTTFVVGSADSFTVTASGFPAPTLSEAAGDTLPAGVKFNAATGILSGNPGPATSGTYTLHFTASNGVGANATQTFTLTVNPLPFSDNFSTATDQQLSDYWINQVGNYRVNTTSGTATGNGTLDLATLLGVNASNVAVQATIAVAAGQSAGLVADYAGSGDQNYYLGGVTATTTGYEAYLYRNLNGVFTALFTQNYTGSANGVLRLEDYESSLKLFLGSTLIAYGDDTTLTGGSVGMRVTGGVAVSNFSASALTVAGPTLPFTGDFTTVTSPEPNQLTSNWINQVGSYSVNTTTGTATGNGSLDLATLVGVSVANATVQANVSVPRAGEDAGLVSRYTGSGDQNYFLGEIVNTGSGVEAYLYQNVNGVFTLLQSQTVAANSGTLVMVTSGTSLTLTYNGVLLFSVADLALPGSGSVGMRSTAGATVSNFSASVPTAGLPFSDTFNGSRLSNSNWLTQAGFFTVASNTATGASTLDLATLLGVTARNVAVQATIAVAAGQSAGLLADYAGSGDQNYYLGGLTATATGFESYLYRNVSGVFTALFTQNYTGSSNGVLRLEVYGSSLKLFLGTGLIASDDDTTFTGGSVGMRITAGAAVSNFSASVLSAGMPSLPFTGDFTTVTSPEPNQLTSNWINQVGNFSVNTTSGTATANGILDLATLVGINARNVAVQATIAVAAGQSAGLLADYAGSGDQNYYLGGVTASATGYEAYLYRNVNGVFTCCSPRPTRDGNGTLDLATLVGVTANNVAVQATIAVAAGQAIGLLADYTGSGDQNYYLGGVTATATGYAAYLYRNLNGVFTPLFTQNLTGSANGVLRLEVYESSLKLFLGSTLIAYGDDSSLTGGSVGMRVTAGAALSSFSASALTVGTPALPFISDFTAATSPEPNQLTNNWINQAGNYSVNTTSGTATGNGNLDLATLVGVSVANVTVQANVSVIGVGEYAALVSRYTGSGDQNYYLGEIVNTGSGVEAYLYQNVNGVFTLLQSQMVAATSGTLVMVTSGTSLTLTYNGVLLFSVADLALPGSGSVGMRTTAGTTISSFSASVPTTDLPFSDTFNGSRLSNSNWLTQAGSFTVASNTATGASTLDLATLLGVTARNVAVQATIAVSAGQAAGLLADYSGSGDENYYLGGVTATATGYAAYLYRNVNGVFTALFTQNYTGSANGVLRLEVHESSLKLFLGSTLIAYGDDSTFTGGSVGMRVTAGAAVSNFSASVLSAGTPSLPFTDGFSTVTSPEPNQLTSNWINQVGNFRVNTTSGTATGNGTVDLATLAGVTATNVAVQATVAVAAGQAAGLVADYAGSGDQNYYLGGVTATATGYAAYLYRNVNDVFTALFTQNYTGSANGVLRLEVYESSLKLFLGSTLIAYGDDSTFTAGSVGMRVTAGDVESNFSAST